MKLNDFRASENRRRNEKENDNVERKIKKIYIKNMKNVVTGLARKLNQEYSENEARLK